SGTVPSSCPSTYTLPQGKALTDRRPSSMRCATAGGGADFLTAGGWGAVRVTRGAVTRLVAGGRGRGAGRLGVTDAGWLSRGALPRPRRRPADRADEVEHRREPLGGAAAQCAPQRLGDVCGNLRADAAQVGDRFVPGRPGAQAFVRQRRQRVLVRGGRRAAG